MRILTHGALFIIGLTLALPARAQTTQSPVRLYQTDQPVGLVAGSTSNSAMSDSLDQIKQINLRLRFSCLKPDCNAALAKFVVNSADGQVAVLSLRPRGDVLTVQIDQGEGGRPPAPEFYSLTLKTGETFDLRLHWTEGHRVSFDLYKADISMLGSTMESHDAQLSSNVQNLQMQVQEAELTLVNQTFVFR